MTVTPFRIAVSDATLDDLRERILRARPAHPRYPADIAGQKEYFAHLGTARSSGRAPSIPLVVSHGWPYSFVEMADRSYHDSSFSNTLTGGAHFTAWEEPDLVADDVRRFFRPLRADRLHPTS